ncbi:MAG: hypothetical protein Q9207_006592 [Kuettlingeria erythrocarpa]
MSHTHSPVPSSRWLSMMAMFKLSLALMFFSKYWSTLYGFGKDIWDGVIVLKAGDVEPESRWVVTVQKGDTVLCGAIVALYQIDKIIPQTLFCRVNHSSSPLSDSLSTIKNAFKALATRIGRASTPSSEHSPDHSVSPKSTDELHSKGQPDENLFNIVANTTTVALIFCTAFLLTLGLLLSVIDYSSRLTSLPIVSIPFVLGPTLMTVWKVCRYVDTASGEDLRRNKLHNQQLDQVKDQIEQLTKRFDNNKMRLKSLEGGLKDPVSVTGQMDRVRLSSCTTYEGEAHGAMRMTSSRGLGV